MGRYVFCYDLSDDRERTRAEKVALRFGLRVQKSVFWCVMENRVQLEALETALRRLDLRSGCVLLIPAPAWRDVKAFGDPTPTAPGDAALTFL